LKQELVFVSSKRECGSMEDSLNNELLHDSMRKAEKTMSKELEHTVEMLTAKFRAVKPQAKKTAFVQTPRAKPVTSKMIQCGGEKNNK